MAKFCPGCGNPIIDSNATFCPKCGAKLPITSPAPQPTDKQKESTLNSAFKWGAIGCGGIILCIVIAAFVFGMAGSSPSYSPSVQPIQTTAASHSSSTIIPTPRITTTPQPGVPTEIELAIGQMASNPERQVTAYSTKKVPSYTVTYQNYPITTQAKSGKIFIFIDVEIKNVGSDSIYASAGDFSISDSEGNRYDPEMYMGDDSMGYFKELYKNQRTKGNILFEIPTSANKLKLYYDFGNLFSGTKLASWTIS